MTKVSIYKSISKGLDTPFNRDVLEALKRIREGKSADVIEWLRSLPKEEYDKKKKNLPYVCFNGTFKYRSKAGIDKRSGLIILDFDKMESFKQAEDFRDSLHTDEYVFAAWISPSGLGVKVLVRIDCKGDHEGYFEALKKHFNSPHWDESGKDVSRTCFESYDPDIYVNPDSLTWIDFEQPELENIGKKEVNIPITSEHEIVQRLMKWWNEKYGMNKGSRNQNAFILAAAFNDFGVPMVNAERILCEYHEKDFSKSEIIRTVKSAYKNTSKFGTCFFEDVERETKIKKQAINGKTHKDIAEENTDLTEDQVKKTLKNLKESQPNQEFWDISDKGKLSLSPHKFKFWLQENNFLKYFPTDSNTFTFVKIENNLVEETSEKRIKDFTLTDLMARENIGFAPYDFMAERTKYFSQDFLSFLDSADIDFQEDTKETAFIYFNNCVLEVSSKEVKQHEYIDLDGYVWKDRVINRDYKPFDHHPSEYRKFLWLAAGQDVERYNSLKSVIGYLMHSFKTSSNNKAIIFNDEEISDNPNGGSGKGLFWNGLSKMKKVSSIDGKTFDFGKSFPYQTVSTDTQVLVFDDVKKNFNFEALFSVITEGITLEYKNQDAIKIPVSKSPKILITTNYTIGGVGGSFDRRKFEVEMSPYFNSKHTPFDEFGHMLFDDWDEEEYLRFDNFMIECLKFYLKNGLVSHDFKNLELRKFIKNTSTEFGEYVEMGEIPHNERIAKSDAHRKFIDDYPDFNTPKFKLSVRMFMKWVDAYCEYKGYKLYTGNSQGIGRWFEIEDEETKTDTPF